MTHCIHVPAFTSIRFSTFGRQLVIADFSGGQISFDGGALFLREDERSLNLA